MTESEFRTNAKSLFKKIKFNFHKDLALPVYKEKEQVAFLRPVKPVPKDIELLTRWRKANQEWFPSRFEVTAERTRNWLRERVINVENKILFMIEVEGEPVGHLGLANVGVSQFGLSPCCCEIDNVVRGSRDTLKGIMTFSLKTLVDWSFDQLQADVIYLRTFSHNIKSILLYERCGFKEKDKWPLAQVNNNGELRWSASQLAPGEKAERYESLMVLYNSNTTNK